MDGERIHRLQFVQHRGVADSGELLEVNAYEIKSVHETSHTEPAYLIANELILFEGLRFQSSQIVGPFHGETCLR